MLYIRFRKIFIYCMILTLSTGVYANKFTSKQCLDSSFETLIRNEGRFFGLLKNDLRIKKNQCQVEIKLSMLRVELLETKWIIDVCREPIHIKLTAKGNQSVYKRKSECEKGSKIEFCEYWQELHGILQDNGLIFASGERENLQSSHGQTFCVYQLLKKYLGDGYLFSKYDQPKDFLGETVNESCVIPASNSTTETRVPVVPPSSVEVEDTNSSVPNIEKKADELIEDQPQF